MIVAHLAGQALLAAAAAFAYETTGDPLNTGVSLTRLGGPRTTFVVVLLLMAFPATLVAILDGRLSRDARRGAVWARGAAVVALAAVAGVLVIAMTRLECDSACDTVPNRVLVASFAAAELGVLASWVGGRAVARIDWTT